MEQWGCKLLSRRVSGESYISHAQVLGLATPGIVVPQTGDGRQAAMAA